MKLTVLGKHGPYPAKDGANSCYLLEENGTTLVLDMGTGSLARLREVIDITTLDAVYISHLHFDHTSDLLPFRYLLDDLKKDITVITQKEDSEWYNTLFTHPRFHVINIDENAEVQLGSLRLRFFETVHPVINYGVIVEGEKTFVYTGDTVLCDRLYPAVKGADLVLCDCAKPADFKGPHMSAADALHFRKETGVKILATHFAPGFDPSSVFPADCGITAAEENKTYEI